MAPSSSYRVLALVSGGKDSCYSMIQCARHGHRVVAMANLRPEQQQVDELDSYMFQTVGHRALDLYARALRLPLFRGRLRPGASLNVAETYLETPGDEVEDLFDLLQSVRRQLDFDAVCSGAILSDYQRVRVEHVCSRLGLVSLSYLWRRDQSELLQDMVQANVRAVLVKVATLGLDERHLGKTLAEVQPHLERMKSKYGINVCGEGGEYETFTLDCPLFYEAIEIENSDVALHANDAFAPVAFLNMKKLRLRDKKLPAFNSQKEMLDHHNLCLVSHDDPVARASESNFSDDGCLAGRAAEKINLAEKDSPSTVASAGNSYVSVSLPWFSVGGIEQGGDGVDSGEAAKKVFSSLTALLQSHGLCLRHLTSVTLLLSDLSAENYAKVNAEYVRHFRQNPPVRICLQANQRAAVALAAVGFKHGGGGDGGGGGDDGPDEWKPSSTADTAASSSSSSESPKECQPRNGLGLGLGLGLRRETMHVQSLSEWAPANIGPYSQAVQVGGVIFVAGQIALDPASMTLIGGGAANQARVSLRHVNRILRAKKSSVGQALQATCFVTSRSHFDLARRAWKENWMKERREDEEEEVEEEEEESGIEEPSPLRLRLLVLPRLPRNADVEWQIVALASTTDNDENDDDDDGDDGEDLEKNESNSQPAQFELSSPETASKTTLEIRTRIVSSETTTTAFVSADVKGPANLAHSGLQHLFPEIWRRVASEVAKKVRVKAVDKINKAVAFKAGWLELYHAQELPAEWADTLRKAHTDADALLQPDCCSVSSIPVLQLEPDVAFAFSACFWT